MITNVFEGSLIMVPLSQLLRLTNALTLAHLDLSASRRDVTRLTAQVQDLQRQLEEQKRQAAPTA